MKNLIILFLTFTYSFNLKALSCGPVTCPPGQIKTPGSMSSCPSCVASCQPGQFVTWTYQGPTCVQGMHPGVQNCVNCGQSPYPNQWQFPYQQQFPWMQQAQVPWWAMQGQFYYPNFHYPGPWTQSGINPQYYPGQGHVAAMKPNIYMVNSSKKLTPFKWHFTKKEHNEFIATTPALKDFGWEGLASAENFRVKNVGYSYLFYDARLDQKNLQWDGGVCVEKENLMPYMMTELKKQKFPEKALKDFHEHWTIKIPNYPFYCVYLQQTDEMNKAMPIEVEPKDSRVTRLLFVVEPHRESPKKLAQDFPQLPNRRPASIENEDAPKLHFLEWGVAFFMKKAE